MPRPMRPIFRVALAVALATHGAVEAAALDLVVDVATDGVDADPGDGACSTTAGACTLRAAIQESNALAGTQTIVLGARLHELTRPGEDENAAATGDLDVTDDVVVEGASAASSIIDANRNERIFEVRERAQLTLSGVTIRGGYVFGENGGGVLVTGSSFVLVARCVFEDNIAQGEIPDPFPIRIGGSGGALGQDATPQDTDPGTILVVASRFAANVADGAAAIDVGNASLYLTDTSIERHDRAVRAVLAADGGTLTIDRSTIWGNRSDVAMLYLPDDAQSQISNTTVSRNVAGGSLIDARGPLALQNVTIHQNAADYAVEAEKTVTLRNTVIVNYLMIEECHADRAGDADGEIESLGHNVDFDGTCLGDTSDRTVIDPGLGPLSNNGGATLTHHPEPDSPLVDTGGSAGCPAFDQRTVDRPLDGDGDGLAVCDVGAVEVPDASAGAGGAAAIALLLARARLRRKHPPWIEPLARVPSWSLPHEAPR